MNPGSTLFAKTVHVMFSKRRVNYVFLMRIIIVNKLL